MSEQQILEAVEENLPEGEEQSDWNWEALAKFSNVRWKTSFRDRDLKKVGRDGIVDLFIESANEAIEKTDLSSGPAIPGARTLPCRRPVPGWSTNSGSNSSLTEFRDLDAAGY